MDEQLPRRVTRAARRGGIYGREGEHEEGRGTKTGLNKSGGEAAKRRVEELEGSGRKGVQTPKKDTGRAGDNSG